MYHHKGKRLTKRRKLQNHELVQDGDLAYRRKTSQKPIQISRKRNLKIDNDHFKNEDCEGGPRRCQTVREDPAGVVRKSWRSTLLLSSGGELSIPKPLLESSQHLFGEVPLQEDPIDRLSSNGTGWSHH
jgi:hypothetical protein